jgi:hypothetical protein
MVSVGQQSAQTKFTPQQPFSDPAIMAASFAPSIPPSDSGYVDASAMENVLRFGPPGFYPRGVLPGAVVSGDHEQGGSGQTTQVEVSAHGKSWS